MTKLYGIVRAKNTGDISCSFADYYVRTEKTPQEVLQEVVVSILSKGVQVVVEPHSGDGQIKAIKATIPFVIVVFLEEDEVWAQQTAIIYNSLEEYFRG